MNKIEIFTFGFSILEKVSRTLAIEQRRDVACKLLTLLYFVLVELLLYFMHR